MKVYARIRPGDGTLILFFAICDSMSLVSTYSLHIMDDPQGHDRRAIRTNPAQSAKTTSLPINAGSDFGSGHVLVRSCDPLLGR